MLALVSPTANCLSRTQKTWEGFWFSSLCVTVLGRTVVNLAGTNDSCQWLGTLGSFGLNKLTPKDGQEAARPEQGAGGPWIVNWGSDTGKGEEWWGQKYEGGRIHRAWGLHEGKGRKNEGCEGSMMWPQFPNWSTGGMVLLLTEVLGGEAVYPGKEEILSFYFTSQDYLNL